MRVSCLRVVRNLPERWRDRGGEPLADLLWRFACGRISVEAEILRAVGLPVGSGVTEGACKSVIKMRTNGSGQRWRPQGLTAVLTLRSLHLSDRLPRFWANFSRRYRNEVLPLCA